MVEFLKCHSLLPTKREEVGLFTWVTSIEIFPFFHETWRITVIFFESPVIYLESQMGKDQTTNSLENIQGLRIAQETEDY